MLAEISPRKLGLALVMLIAGLVAFAAAAAAQARSEQPDSAMTMRMTGTMKMPNTPSRDLSLRGRFKFLSHQTSNQCNLQPAGIVAMPATARLQGSCCAPMDYASYVKQINGLKSYRAISEIPTDPYNISVPLARRMIAFNDQFKLSADEQKVYNQATKLSDEHGPCCCHCWRWTAFQGQARELIVRRRYTASQVAAVWGLEDGCGGNGSGGGMMMGG